MGGLGGLRVWCLYFPSGQGVEIIEFAKKILLFIDLLIVPLFNCHGKRMS